MESFDARIVEAPGGGAYVDIPPEVVTALGGEGRIPVCATFDGIPYEGSIVSMGGEGKILGMLKAIRAQLGKEPGDTVAVTVEADRAERTIEAPADLVRALDQAGLRTTFDGLSYSHRRQYVQWVEEAKKTETRSRRIAQTVERVGPAS